ncbi:ABC transporter substrate-binding protein [Streptomyces milbemycinicus]|uniref:ABC transporter substrate-binding protein n=1 Tax=Streptomyces milbemycinicus TaxID=476552 RepID=A0ABW8LM54_9ACTN
MPRIRPSTPRPAAALAGALCLAAVACGGPAQGPDTSPGAGGARAGYPVTLENCGRTTTYREPPSRVVVMNGASVAEVSSLLALGLGDRVAANAQSYGMSEVKGRARAIAKLPARGIDQGGATDIPRETMLGLRPDAVLSTTSYGFRAENGFATRDDLASAGANSYISPAGCDDDPSRMRIADSYRLLTDLGRIFHVDDRARRLIAASRQKIDAVAAKVKDRKRPRVMVLFSNMSMGTNDFSAIAANGIWNDILAKAGGTNAFSTATRNTFADLSKEKVAAEPVDALVVVSYQDRDPEGYARKLLRQFPQWPAAKAGRYIVLSDSIYLGPSNDIAVDRIARMLHPDAFPAAR